MSTVLLIYLLFIAIQYVEPTLEIEEIEEVLKLQDALESRKLELKEESKIYLEEFLKKTPDEILDNWVKDTNGNIEKSSKKLIKALEWRQQNDIDNILDWEPSPEFNISAFPYRVNGFTDEGIPVLYGQIGLWDVHKAVLDGHRADLLKTYTKMLEKAYQSLNTDPKFNDTVGHWICLMDMNGMSLKQVTSRRSISAFAAIAHLHENYYPQHSRVYIINAPPFYPGLFQATRSLVSPNGFKNTNVFNSKRSVWYPILEKIIPPHAMPKELI